MDLELPIFYFILLEDNTLKCLIFEGVLIGGAYCIYLYKAFTAKFALCISPEFKSGK